MHLTRDAYQREQFLQCVFSGDETYVKTRNLKKIHDAEAPIISLSNAVSTEDRANCLVGP
jgi:hypothetical protein